jgi:hypothetical protein
MAKVVKCPTCSSTIPVPPEAIGQIVKCPGCGKSLKLKAKAPRPAGSLHDSASSQSTSGSIAAMTFAGDAAQASDSANLNDPPELDGECAVCGRPTPADQLREDNGRLVCRDCIKGARSRVERPAGGADLLALKQAAAAPPKRGQLIKVGPMFLAGCAAALVLGGSQIYLNLIVKPVGTMDPAMARASQTTPAPDHGPVVVAPAAATPAPPAVPATGEADHAWEKANAGRINELQSAAADAEAKGNLTEAIARLEELRALVNGHEKEIADPRLNEIVTSAPSDLAALKKSAATMVAATPATQQIASLTPATQAAPTDASIFTESKSDAASAAGVPPTPPAPVAPATPRPLPQALAHADPLARGIDRLQARDYPAAAAALESARRNMARDIGRQLTPDQQMVLVGLAAAKLAMNQCDAAKSPIDLVLAKGTKTRSAVMDNAMIVMSRRSTLRDYGVAGEMLRQYLASNPGDEYAANVFGTLLDKVSKMPSAPKDDIEHFETFLDTYCDAMAKSHPGMLKYGVEWLPADEVQRYRANRGQPVGPAVAAPSAADLAKELDAAKQKVVLLQRNYDAIQRSGAGDLVGAKNQLDAALATVARTQMQIDQIAAGGQSKPAKWLEKLEPVVPEGTVSP